MWGMADHTDYQRAYRRNDGHSGLISLKLELYSCKIIRKYQDLGSSFVGSYFNANKLNLLWMDICCSIQFASMVLQYVLWYFTFHQCSPEANLYILYLMLNTVPWIKYIGTCIILVFYQNSFLVTILQNLRLT